jgi:hypothetical protein
LVITGSGETSLDRSVLDLTVKDVLRTNPKGFGGKGFFTIVNQTKDKAVFIPMSRSRYKVGSDDDVRGILDVQKAYLFVKADDVSSLFIYVEGLVKKSKKLAVNNRGSFMKPSSLLVHTDHAWRDVIGRLVYFFPSRQFVTCFRESE